ncbi:hypothetical protein [Fretibacter rubidus]|uniref:hypothetical protein n=1 Tax=Fretibacter rubidus TaxID=570162 RepID=UPI00352A689E
MTLTRLYRFAIVALASLFFIVQSTSVTHAVSYDEAPHEHDGQVCVIGVVCGQNDVAVVPLIPHTPALLIIATPTDYTARPYAAPTKAHIARAPPPRGPPTHL